MKSEIKLAETKKYPYLGIYINEEGERTVVLFTDIKLGTCVYSTIEVNKIGISAGDWHEQKFQLFNGEITLKN
jgi:hypothetical protein